MSTGIVTGEGSTGIVTGEGFTSTVAGVGIGDRGVSSSMAIVDSSSTMFCSSVADSDGTTVGV